ncbi:unnamed protein product [Heligmosomoides polygyrus]|uniref:Uncharacterized protein n=1 Tax=Heligmosomoides polygyrus TaxID=6339 RepID=A0A183GNP2_HELPZ|nr:unnamed protein product [Heligmosomoides polygyrus]
MESPCHGMAPGETIGDHWGDRQRDGQTHCQDLSESGVCLTGCKQPEIERSGRVVVPAEKTSSRQKNHQSIKIRTCRGGEQQQQRDAEAAARVRPSTVVPTVANHGINRTQLCMALPSRMLKPMRTSRLHNHFFGKYTVRIQDRSSLYDSFLDFVVVHFAEKLNSHPKKSSC